MKRYRAGSVVLFWFKNEPYQNGIKYDASFSVFLTEAQATLWFILVAFWKMMDKKLNGIM